MSASSEVMRNAPPRLTGWRVRRAIFVLTSDGRSGCASRPRSSSSWIRALRTQPGSRRCSRRSTTRASLTMRTPADGTRRKVKARPIDGMLLIDKPAGITSHDVVSAARRALRTRRIGHAGTLDPFATGLLVLLTGHATRLLPHLHGEPKVYDATIVFGSETDTDDVTGTVMRAAEVPDEARVREAIDSLTGAIEQVPPAYSAKQVDGQRAYAAAR